MPNPNLLLTVKHTGHTWDSELFKSVYGNSPAIQQLGLLLLTAEGLGLIPGRGTKIPQASGRGQIKKTYNALILKKYTQYYGGLIIMNIILVSYKKN